MTEETVKSDGGMKPGVVGGRRIHPKANTCANSSLKKRMERQLAGIEGHLANHPNDNLSSARASKIRGLI